MINIEHSCKNFSHKWLQNSIIYMTKHGSHAYGTNISTSDIDLRGIVVPPMNYIVGILDNFEQSITNDPYDLVLFDLRKFAKLAMICNPNAIELLFTELEDHLVATRHGHMLLDVRDKFLSKKARFTFAGYARSQIKRIQRHRRWILNPIVKSPERADFDLDDHKRLVPKHKLDVINAEVTKMLDKWVPELSGLEDATKIEIKNQLENTLVELKINSDDLAMYAARNLGLNDNLIEAFQKERKYEQAIADWKA